MAKFFLPRMIKPLIFHFKRDSLKLLIDKSETYLSNNDIMSAIILWAIIRARVSAFKDPSKFPTACHMMSAFSIRRKGRVDPPLPEKYFGNTLLIPITSVDTEAILGADEVKAIMEVASINRKAVNAMENNLEATEKQIKYFQSAEKQNAIVPVIENMFSPNVITVSNWSLYHVADPKFNAEGKIVFNGLVPHDFRGFMDGIACIINGPDGGFDVVTASKHAYADKFVEDMSKYAHLAYT